MYRVKHALTITCFATLTVFMSCGEGMHPDDTKRPNKIFTAIPHEDSGLAFINHIEENEYLNYYKYVYLYNGGGVGIGDINNDGLPDIYLSSTMGQDMLFLNKGNFRFEDISAKAGINIYGGHKTGINFIDINEDGWMDIYVCRSSWTDDPSDFNNLLFINNKDNSFTESASKYGLAGHTKSVQSVFFDYDNDGDLDMYLANHPRQFKQLLTLMLDRIKDPDPADSDQLFENMGNGRFREVSAQAGINNYGYGLGLSATDFNNDGWTDLYISNDFAPHDFFYVNNGDGTFTESLKDYFPHCSYFSMGCDVTDINHDNQMDLFVVEMLSEDNVRQKTNMAPMDMDRFTYMVENGLHYQYMRNVFQINTGKGTFSDIAYFAGVDKTDWSWATLFGDYDNDGDDDLLVANGYLRDTQDKDFSKKSNDLAKQFNNQLTFQQAYNLLKSTPLRNYAFRNEGNYRFTNASSDWGFDFEGYSNGMAYGDLDNDGDLDVVVNNINGYASLYRNNTNTSHYTRFKLHGPRGNRMGLNSRLQLFLSNGEVRTREFQVSRGFQSSVDPIIHFGLPQGTTPDSLMVRWPDGTRKMYRDVRPGRVNDVRYDKGVDIEIQVARSQPIFTEITNPAPFNFVHLEKIYNDYEDQVLLPHKLSQLGPPMTAGRINGDGHLGLYIGGAHGQPGELWVRGETGLFYNPVIEDFTTDKNHEDVDAVFLDVDSDGDNDLYVVSGSYEFEEGHPLLLDRVYLNDGKGNFKRSKSAIPLIKSGGGCVTAGDLDGDGDDDLFVGSRTIKGKYPHPPQSYLLKNEGGVFVDVTSLHDADLSESGMITTAEWVDYDNDGDSDLIIAGEWTDIMFFENTNGELVRNAAMSPGRAGWWNCIKSADLDGDGLTDIIAGNLGDNYKYQATDTRPFEVFAGDFDNNRKEDIVVCYYSGDKLYPVRGFQCSSEQIPDLKNKFDSYEAFGKASMFEVYGDALDSALHLQATEFSSLILWNRGNGQFDIEELPVEAQLFPVQDMIIKDFTEDNKPDILLAGNWYVSEIETPRADNGIGLFLENIGNRRFNAHEGLETGFYADGDVRSMGWMPGDTSIPGSVFVARNNDRLKIFRFRTSDQQAQ